VQVGHDFFRIHPKGVGLICLRPEGLQPLTLVEEYLGEMHAPWRWFEIQVCQTNFLLTFRLNKNKSLKQSTGKYDGEDFQCLA